MVIARREFIAAVFNKAFIIGLAVMPLMVGLSIWLPALAEKMKHKKERVVAIIDRTPGKATRARETLEALRDIIGAEGNKDGITTLRFEDAPAFPDDERQLEAKFALAEKAREGTLAAFFEIGPRALAGDPGGADIVTYYSGAAFDKDMLTSVAGRLAAIAQLQKSAPSNPLLWTRSDRHYKPEELARMLGAGNRSKDRVIVQRDLPTRDTTGTILDGKPVESAFRALVPVFAILLMFMVVMVGGTPQLHGVLEEKMNRIGEVLLGSATPMEILAGKLAGMSLTGLLLSTIYLGGALFLGRSQGMLNDLRPDIPAWFLLFQVLALLMFGSMFIAVGSACSDMKQAQTMLTPVTMTATLPMLLMLPVIEDPNGTLARVFSLIPPATPMLMLARMTAAPRLPWWEPVLGTILVVLATLATLWVASRIFQNGYLHQGQAPSYRMLVDWLKRRG